MTSARLSPRALTRRRISPGPGSGSGSSSNWRTSAGPVLWKRTIFTVLDMHTPGLLTHHLDGHEISSMQDLIVSAAPPLKSNRSHFALPPHVVVRDRPRSDRRRLRP